MLVDAEAAAVDIPLAAAQEILATCVEEARQLRVLISAAVVDSGGNLKAFVRMDGAEVAGPTLAPDKAYTALAHRTATDELARLAAPGGPLFGLQANAGGRYVIFGGGIPIVVGGRGWARSASAEPRSTRTCSAPGAGSTAPRAS